MLTDYQKQKRKWLRIRKANILKWLYEHDYIINKIFLGEWKSDDPRYTEYVAKREEMRKELDQIEDELMELESKL